jgi:hypothetical protein
MIKCSEGWFTRGAMAQSGHLGSPKATIVSTTCQIKSRDSVSIESVKYLEQDQASTRLNHTQAAGSSLTS